MQTYSIDGHELEMYKSQDGTIEFIRYIKDGVLCRTFIFKNYKAVIDCFIDSKINQSFSLGYETSQDVVFILNSFIDTDTPFIKITYQQSLLSKFIGFLKWLKLKL